MSNVPKIQSETILKADWPLTLDEGKQYVKQTLNLQAEDDIIQFLMDSTLRVCMAYTDRLFVASASYEVEIDILSSDEVGTVIHLPYSGAEITAVNIDTILDEQGEELTAADYPFNQRGRALIFKNQDLTGFYLKISYTASQTKTDQFREPVLAVFAEKYVNRNDQDISKIMEALGPFINYELWV